MRSIGLASVILGAVALLGCGDGDSHGRDAGGGGGRDSGGGGGVDSGPDVEVDAGGGGVDSGGGSEWPRTYTVEIGPIRAEPGEENTVCVTHELPLEVEVMATEIRAFIGPGSHHLIAYRTNAEGTPDPRPCSPFFDLLGGDGPLAMAQNPVSEAPIPDGVGLRVAARQKIRLELHYLNSTGAPIDASGRVEIDVRPDDGSIIEADYAFWGTTDINVPPHSSGSAEHFVRPPPPSPEPFHVFALSTHTHRHAVLSTIERADSAGDTSTTVLHESTDYAEPPIDAFDPPLVFDGSDGIRLRCEYENTTDRRLTFGESADTGEMCFAIAMYYPSRGFILGL